MPASVESRILRNTLEVEAYARGVGADMYLALVRAHEEIVRRLENLGDRDYTRLYHQALLAEVDTTLTALEPSFSGILTEAKRQVIREDYASVVRALASEADVAIPVVAIPQRSLETLMSKRLASKTVDEWVRRGMNRTRQQVKNELAQSLIQGESMADAARRLRVGLGIARNDANVLARTEILNASANAQERAALDHADLVESWKFLATLDSRVCIECGTYDGNVGSISDLPEVPVHPQCRCRRVPQTRFARDIERPAVVSEESKVVKHRDGTTSTRYFDKESKRVASSTTFAQFFETQPEDWKRGYLGAGRYDLYKSGGLDLSDFVNNNGRILGLKELKASMRSEN